MEARGPIAKAENRLERLNFDAHTLMTKVERRVLERLIAQASYSDSQSLEYILNDAAFHEIRRLEKSSKGNSKQLGRWKQLAHRLSRMGEQEKVDELQSLTRHYCKDIVGHFNPRVYRFVRNVLPPAVAFLLSPVRGLNEGVKALGEFAGRVMIDGDLEQIRHLADSGTVVFAPTHSSNLDSVVFGLGLLRAELPPVTYGAGKNLFTNPFISYFMRNLGAYRVDRRLRFALYKEVLKEYSTVLLEAGFHSLFFPGGTRCRSNQVEQKLKLGLLGTTTTAYKNASRAHPNARRIFVVPVTLNYQLVLEAETLIGDFMAEEGKSRYIIDDDEFSQARRIYEFLRKMLLLEGGVRIRFGAPLDPFGNPVASSQESISGGQEVDPQTYLFDGEGNVCHDDQRDQQYTRLLGAALARSYRRNTVFHPTAIVTRALFELLCEKFGTQDIYRLNRYPLPVCTVELSKLSRRIEILAKRIEQSPQWGQLSSPISNGRDYFESSYSSFTTYHRKPILVRQGATVRVGDWNLVYYYQNRTSHIPMERL